MKRKIELIEAVESGKKQKTVAEEFKIAANSVSTIMKNKERYKEQFYSGQVDTNKLRVRLANHNGVETELLKWFTEMRANNVPISGPILKAKATTIAERQGKVGWECNDGWLSRFKKRHNIVFKTLCGESSSVDDVSLDQWRESVLKRTLAKYQPSDVYNADETGLFWRLLPNKTMDFRGQACHGGKAPKDRITVLTCANMDGSHKLPLLAIGKFQTPRCFKGVPKLPVKYASDKKAWMTKLLFTEWVRDFDKQMRLQKRKVLLTLDNCTAHPKIEDLKAVELLFLPPNTTSKSQPCDMGIISNLKCHYRGILLRKMVAHLESHSQTEFKPTLLDAFTILREAWERVEKSTISNCFKKAGFSVDASDEATENITPLLSGILAEYGIHSAVDDLDHLDDDVPTAPSPSDEAESEEAVEEREAEGADEDDQGEPMPSVTDESVTSAIATLEAYFLQKGISDDALVKVKKTIDVHKLQAKKQKTMTNFFKPLTQN